jgi:hypothetical protein
MKIGFKFWQVNILCLAIAGVATVLSSPAFAEASYEVSWESRYSEEKADGEIIDHPPFVSVNDVRLSSFSNMQSVTWRNTLTIDHGDMGFEELFVFTVWQGGASQGEQLMLLSVMENGIEVIGPYGQDFEKLEIDHVNSESAPEFSLIGADGLALDLLHYVSGQFVK